ncbi:NAD(P)-binding protein [Trichoderma pleuroticola]
MSLPTTSRAWSVRGIHSDSFDGLALEENVPLPKLGEHDVLIQIEAVSLNYRDLAIPRGLYPFAMKTPVVPGSDSAGIVLAVGPKVTRVSKGDRVCTLFNEHHQTNPITPEAVGSGLGGAVDGTLRNYGVFGEHCLVKAPSSLNAVEASTLTCAPLTAWNALYGLQSKAIKAGDWVLTQGTGGVSLAAIQFAVAAGATVVSTTSTNDKADALKKLGASHVINYKETPNWGEAARALTPGGLGFDHILEIGGAASIAQSLKAIKLEGVITIIGFLTSSDKQPPLMDALNHLCIVRGIFVGSRQQFEEMNRVIDSAKIRPVIDSNLFSFEDIKKAYQYQWESKHFGKVVIRIGN